ncbi:14542_t:CDS:1, partial [Dentiscutata heterogama]
LDAVSEPKEAPFPYSLSKNILWLVGKEIKMPDKYKPVLKMGEWTDSVQ